MNLFSWVLSTVAVLQVPAERPLTLDEALTIAESNAFSIRIAESNVEKGRQRLSQARGALGPQIGLNGTYNYFFQEQTANFGGQTIVTAPLDTTSVGANLQLPIDIAGNLKRGVRASEASLSASRNNAVAARNDVRLAVRRGFFGVLRAESLVEVAEQALEGARQRAAQGEALFQGAQIARVDLERLRTLVVQSEADVVSARNGLQLARNAFNFLLNRPIETPVVLATVANLPTQPTDATTLVRTAQSRRPEVAALNDTLRALANVRRAQEAGMNPTLGFQLSYSRQVDGVTGFGGGNENRVATLALSVPVFDSGVTRARVKEARQDEEQARINLEQLLLGVSQEVRAAFTNLQGARARLEAATRQVTLAEEVLRLAIVRQQAGEATPLEIVDAQTQLTTARNAVVSARFDYLTAYAELQRAIGSDEVPVAPTTPAGGNP